jgi:hypothetical protein
MVRSPGIRKASLAQGTESMPMGYFQIWAIFGALCPKNHFREKKTWSAQAVKTILFQNNMDRNFQQYGI